MTNPFQSVVFADKIANLYSSFVFGPTSKPIHPGGMPSVSDISCV